jgi:hypothetical protein
MPEGRSFAFRQVNTNLSDEDSSNFEENTDSDAVTMSRSASLTDATDLSQPLIHGRASGSIVKPSDLPGQCHNRKPCLTASDLLRLRPSDTDHFPPLKSDGFIILLGLTKDRREPSMRRSFSNGSKRGMAQLVQHIPGRFTSSASLKQAGVYDENSLEVRRNNANIHLNRLNAANTDNVRQALQSCHLEPDMIIVLLLDRATVDVESPEKSPQLRIFADFAAMLSRNDGCFWRSLQAMSLSKFHAILDNQSSLTTVLQSISIWIGYLLCNRIISRREFFNCMAAIVSRRRPEERASEVLRTVLFACGKVLDSRNYTEVATFYHFIQWHPVKSGYVSFLINDLMRLRTSNWFDQFTQEPTVRKKRPDAGSLPSLFDEVDVQQQLIGDFDKWRRSDDPLPVVAPENVPFAALAHVALKTMIHQMRLMNDFAAWCTELWLSKGVTGGEVQQVLRKEIADYAALVTDNDNARLWFGFFQLLGGLYAAHIIDFALIVEFAKNIPRGAPQPPLHAIFEQLAEVTSVAEAEVVAVAEREPKAVAALVDLVEPRAPRAGYAEEIVPAALYVRDVLVDAFNEVTEATNVTAKIKAIEPLLLPVMRKYLDVAKAVVEAVVAKLAFTESQFNLVLTAFGHM